MRYSSDPANLDMRTLSSDLEAQGRGTATALELRGAP